MATTFDYDYQRAAPLPSPLPLRRRGSIATMEGALTVPPDRTIIGRAVWKTRWVIIGPASRDPSLPPPGSRSKNGSTKEALKLPTDGIFLSVYKTQEDIEPIQQFSVTSIADCQVQTLAHRKQGPPLPTLVINILPDPILDKLRKRRSSRTATFSSSSRDTGPTTLMFRPGDERYTLNDWARFIQQFIQPQLLDRVPMSPITPGSPSFINPFAPRRELSDTQSKPESKSESSRQNFYPKSAGQAYPPRDRPVTFSDTPSLRSKRSDLSSQTSVTQPPVSFYNYGSIVPADLPSPATTIGEYQGDFIEGWTSAQGRSSALSSPVRGRDSVSSQPPSSLPPIADPPGPRETILDRAFQLRRIPGSENTNPVDEKMSSLARFDALMAELEEKRKKREAEEAKLRGETTPPPQPATESQAPQSAWDSDTDDDSDGFVGEGERDIEDRFSMPETSIRRAPDYVSARYEPPPKNPARARRAPPAYNHEALMALSGNGPSSRPQTGYSKSRSNRPGMSQRTHSQPHLATILATSARCDGAVPFPAYAETDDTFSSIPSSPRATRLHRSSTTTGATSSSIPHHEKRLSTSSSKCLSFSEFTRRLSSSTSSLLIVQSNTSGKDGSAASGRATPSSTRQSIISDEADHHSQIAPQSPPQHLHHLHPRAGSLSAHPERALEREQSAASERAERCGWRGSVGVFGAPEGNFL